MTSNAIPARQQETTPFKGKNRRAANRYPVETLLQFRISGSEVELCWRRGRTLDMSAAGIFIDVPEAAPVDSTVELVIDWLGLYHGKPMVQLLVVGTVVRYDHRGTALRIVNHQFRCFGPGAVRSRRTERKLAVA
jgi:hypothetical protein